MGLIPLGGRGRVAAGGGAGPAGSPPGLADVPLAEVGDRRGEGGSAAAGRLGGRVGLGGQRPVGGPRRRVGLGARRRGGRRGLAVDLHVLPQGAGVRVGLVAAADLAVVGLVGGVDMGVLLAVAAVGKLPLAAVELALEGLLPCRDTAMAPLPAGVGMALPAPCPPNLRPAQPLRSAASGSEQQGKASPSFLLLPAPCSPSPLHDSRDIPETSRFPCDMSLTASTPEAPGWRWQGPALFALRGAPLAHEKPSLPL